MTLPFNVAGFERAATEVMDPGPHGYYAGGAADEETLADNVAAWRRLRIKPRVLVDVSRRDLSTTLLGRVRPHPILIAPTAFHRLATPDGEVATGNAAARTGTTMCLSSWATTSAADLATAVPNVSRWFQLYVYRDRGVTRALVDAARDNGYEALVVTVDMAVLGRRERDLRTGFVVGEATAIPTVDQAGATGVLTMPEVAALVDPSLTWDDISAFASECRMPVLVKGLLAAEDARLAVEHGATGVVVSNHGGRQLDGVLATADALPAVVDEVGDDVDVLVDGGIRRGTDIVKALAAGARAVLVGRPILWGLAVAGEAGAARVLEILLAELDNALALTGEPSASALDRRYLAPFTTVQ